MPTIAIIVNQDKPNVHHVTRQLLYLLEEREATVYIEPELAKQLDRLDLALHREDFSDKVDLIFVIGGDGTLLGVARYFAKHKIPILGINVGHLGFLSEAEPDNLPAAVDRVLNGDYYIEERLMLHAELLRDGKIVQQEIAFNDVGVAKGSFSRMITCKVYMDKRILGTYSGDGLIVSSPTGSTAYSLSCGGPVVYPDIQVLLLTPICPHTLTSRPMVLPAQCVLEIHVSAAHHEMNVTIDGQIGYSLRKNDIIIVRSSSLTTRLIKWKERSFFEVVRKKLLGEVERE